MAFLIPRAERHAFTGNIDRLVITIVEGLRRRRLIDGDDAVEPTTEDRMMFFDAFYRFDPSGGLALENVSHLASPRERHYLRTDERKMIIRFSLDEAADAPLSGDITIIIKKYVNMFTVSVNAETPAGLRKPFDAELFHATTVAFWNDFSRFIFKLDPRMLDVFRSTLFNGVFADIRGVFLTKDIVDFEAYPRPGAVAPGWATPALMETLLPIVTDDDEHECTASYMLAGRALFLTSLAPQPLDHPDDKRLPLRYLLLVQDNHEAPECNVSPGQLGRLLDRMHLVGMLRHAALIDLPQLWNASKSLAEIDTAIGDARTAVEAFDSAERPEAASTRASNAVASARQLFNQIGKDFLEDPRNSAMVGLTLRIENSRYYVSQFNSHVRALRLKRVEGFRRYDEFVQRRLGSTFEFIHRLGVRYERAAGTMAGLEQTLATARARRDSEYISNSIDEVRRVGLSIERIQEYGELFLLLFLVPYYILGVIGHLQQEKSSQVRLIILSAILVGTYVTAFRFIGKMKPDDHGGGATEHGQTADLDKKKNLYKSIVTCVISSCFALSIFVYFSKIDLTQQAEKIYVFVACALGILLVRQRLIVAWRMERLSPHAKGRALVIALGLVVSTVLIVRHMRG